MSTLSAFKIPVFWAEGRPEVRVAEHALAVSGLVKKPFSLSIEQLEALATDNVSCRLTSVTRWSVRLSWRGILMSRIARMAGPLQQARYVKFVSHGGGYSTVVSLEDLAHPSALLAMAAEGEDLPVDYGGPVRAVFPHLWGYKSAKSVIGMSFQSDYEAGYWETRGYEDGGRISAGKLFDLNTRQTRFHPGGEVDW